MGDTARSAARFCASRASVSVLKTGGELDEKIKDEMTNELGTVQFLLNVLIMSFLVGGTAFVLSFWRCTIKQHRFCVLHT